MDNFDSIQTHSDYYIAHEYLAYHNHPIYLHQFVDSLNQHQLAYIGDTSFQLSYISWMPHHLREMIDQLSETDYVAREQCLDYLYDVAFRRSLLCHQHLQGYLIQNEYKDMNNNDKLIDETYDCTELFNTLCDVLTRLGYIQPVNL
ncbi:methyltransferase regulatory domain-containing protein [Haemophilus influenzae]|uniref:methyltransferase regulatory domain-containing protein n=1 Tax=Haemophilus influenzae TaxID=727 RepID=UPI00200B6CAD|nr:methyltransferase regulatory domain-containing protein [Haemophilus influenzae]